jgi:hypothetical protein
MEKEIIGIWIKPNKTRRVEVIKRISSNPFFMWEYGVIVSVIIPNEGRIITHNKSYYKFKKAYDFALKLSLQYETKIIYKK